MTNSSQAKRSRRREEADLPKLKLSPSLYRGGHDDRVSSDRTWRLHLVKFAAAIILTISILFGLATKTAAADGPLAWPAITKEARPWAFWWWMGSAVDKTNLAHELQRYHDAGMGGVHIIPIYGAKGWESNYITYLSPKWMDMMGYAVSKARSLGMDVDITTGTGWCFGGPNVSDEDANASVVTKTYTVTAGEKLKEKFDRKVIQALVAFSPEGKCVEITRKITADGDVNWTAPEGSWRVYAISQKPSGQKVKRAAPGGEGWMLNLIYPDAMRRFLQRFTDAFAKYNGPKPRAQYHDSYEYRSDWSPVFFKEFRKRRGYDLQCELPALFSRSSDDHTARVKTDYRETVSDIMADESLPIWVKWSHQHGFITRDQAHGSPGNLLDLYADADIPETEMFRLDRSVLISKFASSAAHLKGGKLTSAETGTWLKEHFTEKLSDMKYLQDDMFLAGINHIFYHGTCYSPDQAPWPGWVFYASYEMNPRNSVWHDVPTLNAYAARCQAVLQSGKPDNDVLLYWPIYDFWQTEGGLLPHLKIHGPDWFDAQQISKAAGLLWHRGFGFDYVSDHWLQSAKVRNGKVDLPGGEYRVVAVPACEFMPLETLDKLLALARSGTTVIFQDHLPTDVPGWGDLEKRRSKFHKALGKLELTDAGNGLKQARLRRGHVVVGDLEAALILAGVKREPMTDLPGVFFIRRSFDGGHNYFIANRSDKDCAGWVDLGVPAWSAAILDPMNGQVGVVATRQKPNGVLEVYLQLGAGESIILRSFDHMQITGPKWTYWRPASPGREIKGDWHVEFLSGGPTLPPSFTSTNLASWTALGGQEAQRFAGTARYSIHFDAPDERSGPWFLSLGEVCQSARVRLNGRDLGTLITPPFRIEVDGLKPKDNVLEVDVTNVSANRIRDLDRRGVKWKIFHDINFVNQNYRPFDASNWPLYDSGLLGPVTLTAAAPLTP